VSSSRDTFLRARTIVLTRAEGDNQIWRSALEELGAKVIVVPSIRFAPAVDLGAWSDAIDRRPAITHIIFTSRHAAEHFARQCEEDGVRLESWSHARTAAVGDATAERMRELGLRVDLVSPGRTGVELAEWLFAREPLGPGSIVLLPRSAIARPELGDLLEASGAAVLRVDLYDTCPELPERAAELIEALDRGASIDWVVFASPSALRGFLEVTGARGSALLRGPPPRAVAIGPTTCREIDVRGFPVAGEAAHPDIDGLIGVFERLARGSRA